MGKLILKNRWNETLEFEIENNLINTLKKANDYTVENDMSGFFFEVKDADPEYIRKENIPTFINSYGEEVAPSEYEIEND